MLKKKYAIISVMVLMAIALTACGDNGADNSDELVMMEPIIVDLTLSSESAKAGENVVMKAKVTQSGNPVEDADKVEFELRREGGGMKVKVPVEHAGEGVYVLEKAFEEAGTYMIIPHVTARGQHSMPMKELKVTE